MEVEDKPAKTDLEPLTPASAKERVKSAFIRKVSAYAFHHG